MAPELQQQLQKTWHHIQQQIPGTQFNFDFWSQCTPRRSTYPACRAVIATRFQNPALETSMILAIQHAYYLQAKNPSNTSTLIELATELGLDRPRFIADLNSAHTCSSLMSEIEQCRSMQLTSFPSLALKTNEKIWHIPVNYLSPNTMLNRIIDLV